MYPVYSVTYLSGLYPRTARCLLGHPRNWENSSFSHSEAKAATPKNLARSSVRLAGAAAIIARSRYADDAAKRWRRDSSPQRLRMTEWTKCNLVLGRRDRGFSMRSCAYEEQKDMIFLGFCCARSIKKIKRVYWNY
jgi:hypothetical protein